MNNQNIIKVTVLLQNKLWVAIFEKNDGKGYVVAREIFGKEPSDPELYAFVTDNYERLYFTPPQAFTLEIKRKNYKRMQRDVKKEMERAKQQKPSSYAQESMRLALEENKKTRKSISKAQKEELAEDRFQKKKAKRKEKHRGH